VLAEVPQPDPRLFVILDDASGRLGQQNLAAMRSGANPGRSADAHADIAVGVQMRLGRMQAHSHPHGVRGNERTLGRDGRRNGVDRAFEHDEERIAFRVDLSTVMRATASRRRRRCSARRSP
jgi:hypothetical protein